ncbi:MAG: methionyl-tRNA formyltransferase [Patescibacteria group bacterium]
MKIVFFGSAAFACNSLQKLIENKCAIKAIVTQPDKPKGRTLKLSPTCVKLLAQQHKLNILEPTNLKSIDFIKTLKNFEADLFVVVAYGRILTNEILSMPKIFTINLHPSMLPKYRGPAPINWAIINGDNQTGVSIAKVNQKLDSGDIILQESVVINKTDDVITLTKRLAEIGAIKLLETVKLIEKNNFKLIPQEEIKTSYARKIKKDDGIIEWGDDAATIINLWRGTLGWPGVYTYLNNKIIKLINIETCVNFHGKAGKILDISNKGIIVSCGKDAILIKQLQPESKKIMSAQEFIQGYKIKIGDSFGKTID